VPSITPVPIPDPGVKGYRFPEAAATIDGWTKAHDARSIHTHAWGVWTAITRPSGQSYGGQQLLVFETWETPEDIQAPPLLVGAAPRPRPLRPLQPLRQFGKTGLVAAGQQTVLGFVKYDPAAAKMIRDNSLLSKAALTKLLSSDKTAVPDFPNTAISLKPVFQPLSSGLVGGRYFALPNWPGPPSPPKPFGSQQWGRCVWIDIQEPGAGTGTGAVDTTCSPNGGSRSAATTYGLGRFISFKDDKGIPNVLLAMHLTTREIRRWTWQTHWWDPDPSRPQAPSSAEIAKLRPPQLTGAAANYSHCVAYAMEDPPQPETGGSNTGDSVYCYNPWLEAGFSPQDLPDSLPGTSGGKPVTNDVGVQTNCMSCQARANFAPAGAKAPGYSGDRYVDLADPKFKGTLQVDLLWSLADLAK
jgi:hypothetical protein